MRQNKKILSQQGVTLVELMVVLAIIGVLAAVSIPNILSWLPNSRMHSAARDLYGTLMKAKGEAAKRNKNCTVTFNQVIIESTGPETYAYVLFEDNNPPNSAYDVGEPVIREWRWLEPPNLWPPNVFLDTTQGGGDGLSFPNRGPGCAGNPAITFRPTTIPVSDDGCGLANGSAFFINTNGQQTRVIVSNTGNVRIE